MHPFDNSNEALLAFSSTGAAQLGRAVAAAGPIDRAIRGLRRWHKRRQTMSQLALLDAHLLSDVGLTRDGLRIDRVA